MTTPLLESLEGNQWRWDGVSWWGWKWSIYTCLIPTLLMLIHMSSHTCRVPTLLKLIHMSSHISRTFCNRPAVLPSVSVSWWGLKWSIYICLIPTLLMLIHMSSHISRTFCNSLESVEGNQWRWDGVSWWGLKWSIYICLVPTLLMLIHLSSHISRTFCNRPAVLPSVSVSWWG